VAERPQIQSRERLSPVKGRGCPERFDFRMAGIEFIEFVEFVGFVELAKFMESRDTVEIEWRDVRNPNDEAQMPNQGQNRKEIAHSRLLCKAKKGLS